MDKTNNDGGVTEECVQCGGSGVVPQASIAPDRAFGPCPSCAPWSRQAAIAQHEGLVSHETPSDDTQAPLCSTDDRQAQHEGDEKPVGQKLREEAAQLLLTITASDVPLLAERVRRGLADDSAFLEAFTRLASTPATPAKMGELESDAEAIILTVEKWKAGDLSPTNALAGCAMQAKVMRRHIKALQSERDAAVADVGRLRSVLVIAEQALSAIDGAHDLPAMADARPKVKPALKAIRALETGDTSHAEGEE